MPDSDMCDCADKPHLTEDDVRRIVSDALVEAITAATSRGQYNNGGGELRVNGVPVHGA